MKKLNLILVLFLSISVYSQKEEKVITSLKFDKSVYDIGIVYEEKGKVTNKFFFKNVSKNDITLTNVRASCGCTTADYTKEVVGPGKKGFVSATFNPEKRNGNFEFMITITTNETTNNIITFKFKGKVVPKPKSLDDIYNQAEGSLKFKQINKYYNISNTQKLIDTIFIYNPTQKTIQISDYKRNVAYVSILKIAPEELKPKKEGIIVFEYDAAKRNELGNINDIIYFKTNDSVQFDKYYRISGTINEDFSKLTPQELENAPVIVVDNNTFDFGKIKTGESITNEFVISNQGKTKLIIRKVQSSCGCTAVAPEKKELEPGESTKIKAIFNSSGRSGMQHKNITIISNDPKNTIINLSIKGEVVNEK